MTKRCTTRGAVGHSASNTCPLDIKPDLLQRKSNISHLGVFHQSTGYVVFGENFASSQDCLYHNTRPWFYWLKIFILHPNITLDPIYHTLYKFLEKTLCEADLGQRKMHYQKYIERSMEVNIR